MTGPHPEMADLVADIETFLRGSPMSAATFGHLAMGDSELLNKLRAGRQLRPASVAKVEGTLALWRRRYAEREAFRSNPAVRAAVAAAVARREPAEGPGEEHRRAAMRWWQPGHAARGSAMLAAALRSVAA